MVPSFLRPDPWSLPRGLDASIGCGRSRRSGRGARLSWSRSVRDKAMLQGEEGRSDACGNADLLVYVLHVVTNGLRRDEECFGHLPVRQAARYVTQHLQFAVAEPTRQLGHPSRCRMSGGYEQSLDDFGIQLARLGQAADQSGCSLGPERPPMRPL